MAAPVVVVDSSVIYLLLAKADRAAASRRDCALVCMAWILEQGLRFVVPAPAIVEVGNDVAIEALRSFSTLHIEQLGLDAALHGATMHASVLAARRKTPDPKPSRVCVKYDLMIAAIAHHLDAKYLVTADPKSGAQQALAAVGSKVEILRADVFKPKGQLPLLSGPKS